MNFLRLNIKLPAVCVMLLSFVMSVAASATTLSGVVIDSVSGAPVPYASVVLVKNGWGKLTDGKGRFSLSAELPDTLAVSAMGYSKKMIPVATAGGRMKIVISPDGVLLGEVIVRPRKEKYSKKNNPAVDFVNRIRRTSDLTDPRRNDYYNFDKYERITIALDNINPESNKNLILKKFDFLRDHIDTSEVSGKPILNISTREKASSVHFRKDPKADKEVIAGVRQSGLDDFGF